MNEKQQTVLIYIVCKGTTHRLKRRARMRKDEQRWRMSEESSKNTGWRLLQGNERSASVKQRETPWLRTREERSWYFLSKSPDVRFFQVKTSGRKLSKPNRHCSQGPCRQGRDPGRGGWRCKAKTAGWTASFRPSLERVWCARSEGWGSALRQRLWPGFSGALVSEEPFRFPGFERPERQTSWRLMEFRLQLREVWRTWVCYWGWLQQKKDIGWSAGGHLKRGFRTTHMYAGRECSEMHAFVQRSRRHQVAASRWKTCVKNLGNDTAFSKLIINKLIIFRATLRK